MSLSVNGLLVRDGIKEPGILWVEAHSNQPGSQVCQLFSHVTCISYYQGFKVLETQPSPEHLTLGHYNFTGVRGQLGKTRLQKAL